MPQVGGGSTIGKPKKKKTTSPISTVPNTKGKVEELGAKRKKGVSGGSTNTGSTNPRPGPGAKEKKAAVDTGIKKKTLTGGNTDIKVGGKKFGGTSGGTKKKAAGTGEVKQTLDYSPSPTKSLKKRRFGGSTNVDRYTGGGGRAGGGGGDRFGGDRVGLPGTFRDRDLVGSGNQIDNYDGSSEFVGAGNEFSGGGGGTASSLAGRESVGRVGKVEGQSMEEIVYGVQKRGRKIRRPKGE